MVNMKFLVYNKINYIPNPLTPEEFVQEKIVIKRKESLTAILKQISDIMAKTPASKRRSMESFIPLDMAENSAEELDPRVDDGLAPAAPSNVILTSKGIENRLSFSPSSNPNVVGYRLYRSINSEGFQKKGKLTSDQAALITDTVSSGEVAEYYMTSVNIVGKESAPSNTVFSDGSSGSIIIPDDGSTGSTGTNGSDGSGAVIAPPPSVPQGMTFKLNGLYLQIDWQANPANESVNQYNVYYSDTENGAYQKIGTSAGLPQFQYFSGIYDGYYRVSAINKTGESDFSHPTAYKAP
jgi:penicillin-binding protein